MRCTPQYLAFWSYLYSQISDLYGDLNFEEFVKDPWTNLVALSDPHQEPGVLLALSQPRIYSSIDELPKLGRKMDLDEIAYLAEEVLLWRDRQNGSFRRFVLH